jgi:hypothetical protein
MRDFQISPESGYALSLTYSYMGPWGNTSYHAGSGEGMIYLSGRPLPKHHVVKARAAAWTSPPQQTILTGSQQGGGEYGSQLFTQTFVVRGYPYGEFIGSSLYNGSLEYRLPLSYVYEGWGTRPVFLNSLHLNFVGDVITLYGGYYDSESSGTLVSARPGVYFASTGVELKGDFQFFYGFPLMFKLGYYYGFTQKAYGGSSVYFGFGSTF